MTIADSHDEVSIIRNELSGDDALEAQDDVYSLANEGEEVLGWESCSFPF